ncbi:MAG: maltose acetyltransferase domain-containing protein [Waltera sp.]
MIEEETRCADLCYEFNQCRPSDTKTERTVDEDSRKYEENPVITAPFYCDYRFTFRLGKILYLIM